MRNMLFVLVSALAAWSAILVQPVNIIDPVNPGTAVYIYWRTATDATILYGINDFSHSQAGTTKGIHLTGLTPGVRYQYKVVCAIDTSIKGSFRTAPPTGTPFSYAVFGDIQLEGAGERVYFREIHQNFKVDLMLIEGDLTRCDISGGCGTLVCPYDTLFSLAPELFANTTLVPAAGNHDYPPEHKAMFNMLPDSGLQYLFNYGSAAFVVINYVGVFGTLDDSFAARHEDFKIGMVHNPSYSTTQSAYSYQHGYFFEKAGGDIWYAGDAHGYWRTKWIQSSGDYIWTSPPNPPISISDTEKAGHTLYCNGGASWTPGSNALTPADWCVVFDYAHPSYSIVTVDSVRPRVLNQKAYLYGTGLTLLDSFSIDHSLQTPSEAGFSARNGDVTMAVAPNPFNPVTTITVNTKTPARLSVYSLNGQLLRSWAVQGGNKAFRVTWDGRDSKWQSAAAGIYLIRVESGFQSSTIKVVLTR